MLTNASGVHGPKGAEFALTALLMLNHRIPQYVSRQREARWEQAFSSRIEGKTVVIVGVGSIGAQVARLARRFGMRVLGIRRSAQPHRWVEAMYGPGQLHDVLPRADFLVITAPLTDETRGLIGRRELSLLPPHAGLVNLGRAGVVDYDALVASLESATLAGAVLDVFPEEPLPRESPVWSARNVIISPHCGVDDAREYVPRFLEIFFENVRRYLAGRPLRNRVKTKQGY
jgi:phosphoglycerate dehydrogenase-like enzyme